MPKKPTEHRLARRLAIINILPRLDKAGTAQGMTVDQVMARLGAQHGVDRRTYERDLQELGDEHGEWRAMGVEVIGRRSARDARTNEWFTTERSRILLFKSLTPIDALIASFARQELSPFLPSEARQSLDDQIAMVEEKVRHLQLTSEHRQGIAYKDKIRRIPDGAPLAPSMTSPEHLQAVNDALMQNTMLHIVYRAAKARGGKRYVVYPIGLVIHDRSVRLLAIEEGQLPLPAPARVVKSFLLHRMQEVENAGPVPRNLKVPTLDEAIASGALDMWSRGVIHLHLQFAAGEDALVFARTLEEMPLAADQRIEPNARGQLELTASVTDTSGLRRMLQSMAREVKVLGPGNLKDDIRKFLRDGLAFQYPDEEAGSSTAS